MGQGTPGEQGPQGPQGPKGPKGPRGTTGEVGTKGPPLTTINYTSLVNQLMTNQDSLNKISSELLTNNDKLPNIFANFIASDPNSTDSINTTISQNPSYIKLIAKTLAENYTSQLRGKSGPIIDTVDYDKMSNNIITNINQLNDLSQSLVVQKINNVNPIAAQLANKITSPTNMVFKNNLNVSLTGSPDIADYAAKSLVNNNATIASILRGDPGPIGNLGSYYDVKNTLFTTTLTGAKKPATLWCADGKMCQTPDDMNGIVFGDSSLLDLKDNLELKTKGNIEFKSSSTINIKNDLNINPGSSLNTRSINFGGTNVGMYVDNNNLNFYSTQPNASITKDGVLNIPNGKLHLHANIGSGEGRLIIGRGQNDQLEFWFNNNPILVVTTDGDVIFNGEINTDKIEFPNYNIREGSIRNANTLMFAEKGGNGSYEYTKNGGPFPFVHFSDGHKYNGYDDGELITIVDNNSNERNKNWWDMQRWVYRWDNQVGKQYHRYGDTGGFSQEPKRG